MPYKVEKGHGCPDSKPYAVVKESDGTRMGCHETQEKARAQQSALYANEADAAIQAGDLTLAQEALLSLTELTSFDLTAEDTVRPYGGWEGPLTLEGSETGDGREFAPGSLVWDEPPLPLSWQPVSHPQHEGSVLVGLITHAERVDAQIMGKGIIDLGSDTGREVFRLMGGDPDHPELGVVGEVFLKGVSVDVDSVKDADVEIIMPDGPEDSEDLSTLFAAPEKIVFHKGRMRGATLLPLPAFTEAAVHLTSSEPSEPAPAAGPPLAAVPARAADPIELTASGIDLSIPDLPPAWWFDEPTDVVLDGALTVLENGRVFGLLAPSRTPHINPQYRGATVPMGDVDYSHFLRGVTVCADGERIVTGNLTMACGHARLGASGEATTDHYDNTCSLFARVNTGESTAGPWIAGALFPDVEPVQIIRAMACQASGDWRPHQEGRFRRRLHAALLVPVTGFPSPRRSGYVRYQEGEMVASAVPVRFGMAPGVEPVMGGAKIADRIAASIGRDRPSRAAALVDKVRKA